MSQLRFWTHLFFTFQWTHVLGFLYTKIMGKAGVSAELRVSAWRLSQACSQRYNVKTPFDEIQWRHFRLFKETSVVVMISLAINERQGQWGVKNVSIWKKHLHPRRQIQALTTMSVRRTFLLGLLHTDMTLICYPQRSNYVVIWEAISYKISS
jgi:hypothetical protein